MEVKRSTAAIPQSIALASAILAVDQLSTAASKPLRKCEVFGIFSSMEGTRVGKAVARMETALTRIERAASAMPDTPPIDPVLAERNRTLESALRDGMAELDRLIEKLER